MPKLSRVEKLNKGAPAFRPAINPGEYCNRTYCSTLEDIRRLLNWQTCWTATDSVNGVKMITIPVSAVYQVVSLVEELQVYGNRMEAGLQDKREYRTMKETAKTLRADIKELEKKKAKLEKNAK